MSQTETETRTAWIARHQAGGHPIFRARHLTQVETFADDDEVNCLLNHLLGPALISCDNDPPYPAVLVGRPEVHQRRFEEAGIDPDCYEVTPLDLEPGVELPLGSPGNGYAYYYREDPRDPDEPGDHYYRGCYLVAIAEDGPFEAIEGFDLVEPRYAENHWSPEDLAERFGLAPEEAVTFLLQHEKALIEAQSEAGWNYLLQHFDEVEEVPPPTVEGG